MGANNSVPANYSAAAYAVLTLEIILTITAVVGRTVSQSLMKATPASDDYLCYFAFIANLGLLVSGILLTAFGALDVDDLLVQSEGQKHSIKAAYNSLAVFYICTITLIKLSLLFLYWRTFTMFETWFRWCWWILLNFVMLWFVTCIVLLALREGGKMPKSDLSRLGISITALINALSDMLFLILPATIIFRKKLQKEQKVALISIFGIGAISSIVSVVRGTIVLSNRDHKLNEAYSNYLDIILTATESSAGLICACLPPTKPIIIRFSRWFQILRGLDADHQGWTTVSASTKNTGKQKDMKITRVDDYHVQLLPVSKFTNTQSSLESRDVMDLEKPWQSVGIYETRAHCESNTPNGPSIPATAR